MAQPGRGGPLPDDAPSLDRIDDAQQRLARCAAAGRAVSRVGECGRADRVPPDARAGLAAATGRRVGVRSWYLKRDDELPVAGSIKARGGFHEVLALAESIALEHGLLPPPTPTAAACWPQARALFGQYAVTVGSTGNLGMSIGVMAAALGFDAVVHVRRCQGMEERPPASARRARHRARRRLRQAVAAGRAQALAAPRSHFVDDEQSELLFFGYAAARGLARQLAEAGRKVDAGHPLFVYIPAASAAPGGITHGLKALYGDHVHCFAEPVASPCMLVQLAAGMQTPTSVYDLGLDNRTEADGLAVGQASGWWRR